MGLFSVLVGWLSYKPPHSQKKKKKKKKKNRPRVFPDRSHTWIGMILYLNAAFLQSASTKLGYFSVPSLFPVEGRHLVCIRSPSTELQLQLQQEDCVISSPRASWSCLVPERNTTPSPWSPHVTELSVMEAPHRELETLLQIHQLCAAPPHPPTVHDAYVILFWIITPTFLSYLASEINVFFWCNVMLTFARYT